MSGKANKILETLAENLADKALSVSRTDHHLMGIRVIAEDKIVYLLSVYASQTGRTQDEKDSFYNALMDNISTTPTSEHLINWRRLQFYAGKIATSFNGIHIGHGYGIRITMPSGSLTYVLLLALLLLTPSSKNLTVRPSPRDQEMLDDSCGWPKGGWVKNLVVE